jgi:ribosomal protein S18 acetylase RimI-like enzyme
MFFYGIDKMSLKKIKSTYVDFFPYVLKGKSFEKIIKEYQYIAYAKDKRGKIISCVLFKEYLEFPKIWQLGRISTNRKYLGKGIASNLLKIISDFIICKDGKKILVYVSDENKIAKKFYLKNNFKNEAKIEKMKLGKSPLYIFSKEL